MQARPDHQVIATATTVEHVVGDGGMTYLSKAFSVERFSLDVNNTHDLEPDCKTSVNTIV